MSFGRYNNVDLHVGFRVHSHIYCMSKRIPSILVSEDARGTGCNQTMGLPDILDYSIKDGKMSNNFYLGKQIEYYLDELLMTDFELLSSAYVKMGLVYDTSFKPFIERICNT